MNNPRTFQPALTDNDTNRNSIYNNDKKKIIINSKNSSLSKLPKVKAKKENFSSKSSPNLPKIGIIYKQRTEYKLHPIRRLIPKNVANNSNNNLIIINKPNTIENNKLNDFIKNNYNNFNLVNSNIIDKKSTDLAKNIYKEEKDKKKLENKNIGKNENTKNQKRKKKKKKNNKFDLFKNLIKQRRLFRIKNLYDSIEDTEEEIDDEYVINPETNIIIIYDFLIFVFFIYNFFVSTLSLCSMECFCQINNKINYSDIILFINDLLYIIDLILSFFRGYYNFEYKLIKITHIIIMHYLTSDFIFDLLSAIPIFSISKYICLVEKKYSQCFKYEIPSNLIILKLLSVLKILKIKKIINHKKNQSLNKLIEFFSENYTIENIIRICINSFVIIGILHCIVCVHVFLGNHSYLNWLVQIKAEDQSLIIKYLKSLYFIIATLTTIGYGDIVCHSFIERIFQIILLAIGSIIYPLVISYIGNIVKKHSNAADKQEHDLSMLEKIRKDHPNMSFELYMNIYNHLETKVNSLIKYDVNSFIETLPFSLKNNILFTMYRNHISNFKFFSNNNNSVFIAEVLNNFIPHIAKKNKFLICEGELVEEIIFIKNGRISFNAAINIDDPSISINRYFTDNFLPFTVEEENKIIKENLDNKSISSSKNEISYENTKIKIDSLFTTIINPKEFHLSQIIEDNIHNNNYNDKEGIIIKNDGSHHYLKIIEIRKNEHFGCVLISLNKPCPLSLQVKSKIAELFLINKGEALNLSKNYPNIWRKLYEKEFHNIRMIKKKTFSILKKYTELKNILINKNYLEIMGKMTNDELNPLEKTPKNMQNKKSIRLKEEDDIPTPKYNYFSKRERLNSEEVIKGYIQSEMAKKIKVKRSNTFSGTNLPLIPNKKFESTYSHISNQKSINFENMSELNILNGENTYKKAMSLVGKDKNYEIDEKINKIYNKKKTNKKKLKNLKYFLIQSKNFFKNNNNLNDESFNQIYDEKGSEDNMIKINAKKQESDFKYINNQIHSDNNKKDIDKINNKIFEFDSDIDINKNLNKFCNGDQILKGLKDICEEETNFSFFSTNKQIRYKNEELSIDNNSNFEIISVYSNLNDISKGKYINDIYLQNKIKLIIHNYYLYKNKKMKYSSKTIVHSKVYKNIDNIKEYERNEINKDKQMKKKSGKKLSKHKIKEKKSENNILNKLDIQEIKKEKKDEDKINENVIHHKKRKNSINSLDINFDKTINDYSILNEIKREAKINTNSIKVNKSKISSSSKKSSNIKRNKSLIADIKKNVNIYNSKEVEFIIDKEVNEKTINHNIYINNNSYVNNNFKIYKNKGEKYYKYNESLKDDNNNQLINQILGIKIPNHQILRNNILTSSSNINELRDNYNSVEKIKKMDSSQSIYNIYPNNLNKNMYSLENVTKVIPARKNNFFCNVF